MARRIAINIDVKAGDVIRLKTGHDATIVGKFGSKVLGTIDESGRLHHIVGVTLNIEPTEEERARAERSATMAKKYNDVECTL